MTPVSWDHGERGAGGAGSLSVAGTRDQLQIELERLRRGGGTLALVPTMGFLHPGHLALLDRAASLADHVVLSIFVNPLQFGPGEDLDRYPRSLGRDLELAAARGADLAFTPSVEAMYPAGPPRVRVDPGAGGQVLCGAFRPGHFEGVLTVVARLFGLIRPDVAVFGRKDAQQVALVREMSRDLELGVEIEVGPLVREPDGLAMSSRNAYLSAPERQAAPRLFEALESADLAFRNGEARSSALEARVRDSVAGFGVGGSGAPGSAAETQGVPAPSFRLEYAEVVDPGTLERARVARPGHLLAVAGWLGATRLIDNVVMGAENPDPRVPGPVQEA